MAHIDDPHIYNMFTLSQILTSKIEYEFGERAGGNDADFHGRTEFTLSDNSLKLWDSIVCIWFK